MLPSKIMTEIRENHSEFSGSANSCNKFVSGRYWSTMKLLIILLWKCISAPFAPLKGKGVMPPSPASMGQCAWVNSLIKLRTMHNSFHKYKTTWLVRIRQCALGLRLIVKVWFWFLRLFPDVYSFWGDPRRLQLLFRSDADKSCQVKYGHNLRFRQIPWQCFFETSWSALKICR